MNIRFNSFEIGFSTPFLRNESRIVAFVDELMALCDLLKERLSEAQSTQSHLADTLVEQGLK